MRILRNNHLHPWCLFLVRARAVPSETAKSQIAQIIGFACEITLPFSFLPTRQRSPTRNVKAGEGRLGGVCQLIQTLKTHHRLCTARRRKGLDGGMYILGLE